MFIIPALPGCGQPATAHFEIYSPAGGAAHGSLDATAYACDGHAETVRAAIFGAGLTPYRTRGPIIGEHVCGETYVFPTAGQPERPQLTHQIPVPAVPPVAVPLPVAVPVEEPEHPAWCVRAAICRVEAIHCSAPYTATPPGAAVHVRVWIEQPDTVPAVPVVVLEVVDEYVRPVEYRLVFDQAAMLADQVRVLIALVGE